MTTRVFLRTVQVLVVLSLVFTVSCKKDKDKDTAAPIYVQHDTRYVFNQDYIDEIYPTDKIKASSDSTEVRYVYLVPNKHFKNFQTNNITIMIDNVLRPAIGVSQKVKGEGNFEFTPGVVTVTDSTWLVKQGWTVNRTK